MKKNNLKSFNSKNENLYCEFLKRNESSLVFWNSKENKRMAYKSKTAINFLKKHKNEVIEVLNKIDNNKKLIKTVWINQENHLVSNFNFKNIKINVLSEVLDISIFSGKDNFKILNNDINLIRFVNLV